MLFPWARDRRLTYAACPTLIQKEDILLRFRNSVELSTQLLLAVNPFVVRSLSLIYNVEIGETLVAVS